MAFASSTATRNWPRSWAAMISAHADRASGSRSAACGQVAFDGVNRDHYFQGMTIEPARPQRSGRAIVSRCVPEKVAGVDSEKIGRQEDQPSPPMSVHSSLQGQGIKSSFMALPP